MSDDNQTILEKRLKTLMDQFTADTKKFVNNVSFEMEQWTKRKAQSNLASEEPKPKRPKRQCIAIKKTGEQCTRARSRKYLDDPMLCTFHNKSLPKKCLRFPLPLETIKIRKDEDGDWIGEDGHIYNKKDNKIIGFVDPETGKKTKTTDFLCA